MIKKMLAFGLVLSMMILSVAYALQPKESSHKSFSHSIRAALMGSEACDILSSQLGARYVLTTSQGPGGSMEYWRDDNRVMYTFPERQIADQWTLTRNGYLKPTRYFLSDERAIEYDVFDINRGKGSKSWQTRANLITPGQIALMELVNKSGTGCSRVEIYNNAVTENSSRTFTNLIWMPDLQLVYRYEQDVFDLKDKTNRLNFTWQLKEKITGGTKVGDAFNQYRNFAATDYADIGDNESDPFLMKMIRLGFIRHGSSGFYDAQGNSLGMHQGHVHGIPLR